MKLYTKDGQTKYDNQIVIIKDGMQIINPTEEQILADGWVEYVAPTPQEPTEEEKLQQVKNTKIAEISAYDVSDNVNFFTYKGQIMWLSREDRIVLKDRFEREKSNSVEITNLYYNGYAINITPDEGIYLIDSISAYADKCFDNTQKNISLVNACMSVEEVNAIDITAGYPDKLIFE